MIPHCPDHDVDLVPAPIDGLVFCPIPGCQWWHGWPKKRSFTLEAKIERSEELRVDRLGPTEDDIERDRAIMGEERPVRTLG